jgi:hypothetical protein
MIKRRRPQRGRVALPPHTGEPPATNPALRAAILEVVDTQLEQDDPPETRQTLERLVVQGHTREGARELIATVVISEIFDVMASGKAYDAARYKVALAQLPQLPWDA